ncbi:hypothetical protein L288_10930 [Sphingobium quisquiliarum P25]|uniref:Addiction module antitoxin n=1 Tax=Sphingobium quisquiliarum P25 TaxID=1329909 RepID=T0I4D8_9SPHN|nr:type II toxin-antitoxin system RelE/ParE family toxin [Sphingobium quisquiliarum]EQB06515.1 hypothetical protein L288_10930 [Sphingobium quisquiliarum P25]
MPHIIWRPNAREEARQIIDYISDRNLAAAAQLAELTEYVADRLADPPYVNRAGRVPDTREAIITPNYMLVYRVGTEVIEILAIKHTRQQYP